MAIKTFDVVIGQVYNNGVLCPNPVVEFAGQRGVALPCKDEDAGIYTVEYIEGQSDEACLTFIIRCEDCGDCAPLVKEICFCDTIDDCPDCNNCVGGICESLCDPGEICVNDICTNCVSDDDCPCNQVCTQTGCQCPVNTTLNEKTGCCDNCSTNADCPSCFDCDRGTCIPRDCALGVCDVDNDTCVECLSSSDCGVNECCEDNKCECCTGFVKVNGVCVPGAECTSDLTCMLIDPCLRCELGNCVPQQCPGGQIPVNIGGVCECKESCDCENPGCSKVTDYCKPVSNKECACVSCEGDCTNGCEDPCYCSPTLNKCINNPCAGTTCTDGTDCPESCGCLNGQCVPCETLSCANDNCDNAMGCGCVGNTCTSRTCTGDCATAFDCADDCTCHEGKCTHCDNFSCAGSNTDCDQKVGCECNGADCVGTDKDCSDSLEITKDDANCEMTGTLTTSGCCACPAMTLDVKGKRSGENTNEYQITFLAELRKGSFDGITPDTNPLVDDFTNDNIAENEPPTSGVVGRTGVVTWKIFTLNSQTGLYDYTGTSEEELPPASVAFPASGDTGTLEFPALTVPKIGIRVTASATTQKEASDVTITFTQSSTLNFPNLCSYTGGVTVDEYKIVENSQWLNFGTDYSNPIATTVTADDCREPLFRWFKDGNVVKKEYISGGPTYSDTISRPPYDWLESCADYVLKADCNCSGDANRYLTFCSPEDIGFELTACNTKFTLKSFPVCTPNLDEEFFITAGSIDLKFTGMNPPINVEYESTSCISQIQFGMTCAAECTKTYDTPCPDLEITLGTGCDGDGTTFTLTVPQYATDQSNNQYEVSYVVLGGNTYLPGSHGNIPAGQYTAAVYVKEGCDFFEVEVVEECCGGEVTPLNRTCEGTIEGAATPGWTYYLNDIVQTDIIAALEAYPLESFAEVQARKGDCSPVTWNFPPLSSFCCENFAANIIYISDVKYRLTVLNASETLSADDVTLSPVATVTAIGGNVFEITNFTPDTIYTITIVDPTCGILNLSWTPQTCELGLVLEVNDSCELVASIDPQECECRYGTWDVEITNIVDQGTTLDIYWESNVSGFDASLVTGELYYTLDGVKYGLGTVVLGLGNSGVFNIAKPVAVQQTCVQTDVYLEIQDELDFNNRQTLQVTVTTAGLNMTSDPQWTSYTVTATSGAITQSITTDNGNGIFVFPGLVQGPVPAGGAEVTVEIEAVNTDTNLYEGGVTTQAYEVGSDINRVFLPNGGICTSGVEDNGTAQIRFTIEDLELTDECTYVNIGQNFTVTNLSTWTPTGDQSLQLSPVSLNARKTKFTWVKDGNWPGQVVDWQDAVSQVPAILEELGATYYVQADCQCSEGEELQYCCVPATTLNVLSGNAGIQIILTGTPGSYNVNIDGTDYPLVILSGATTATVTHSPILDSTTYTVTTSIVGTSCSEQQDVTTYDPFVPTFSFRDCGVAGANLYNVDVVNGQDGFTTVIISGTADIAANGYDIENADITDVPTVYVVDNNGMQSSNFYLIGSCFSSSGAPSSSGLPPSSSVPASSSLIPGGSSSVPASSSAVVSSSNIPDSSSTLPDSSSGTSSAPGTPSSSPVNSSSRIPDSSSAQASSSNIVSSSNPASSSNVVSSSVPQSSALVPDPSSSPQSSSGPGASGASSSPGGLFASSSAPGTGCTCTFEGQACGDCGTCINEGSPSVPIWSCAPIPANCTGAMATGGATECSCDFPGGCCNCVTPDPSSTAPA